MVDGVGKKAQGVLSVILPSFNLGSSLAANLASVEEALDPLGIDYELIPVDDGSSDDSSVVLQRVAAADMRVRPVILARNCGKGGALKAGFAASRGELVLLLDGDLDIAPRMLPGFLETMEREKADVVIGSKRHPLSKVQYPWHRRLASMVYFGMVRLVIGLPITDTQTGMKLFKRKVLGDALERMLVKTYAFDLELLAIASGRGAKIVEAPVEIRFGSKFGALRPRTVREMLQDTLAVFYRLRVLDYYAKVEVPPPAERPPHVTIVVACPRPSAWLSECLEGMARQTHREFDVIVLPDDPAAGLSAPADEAGRPAFELTVIATGKVRPAEKRNIGIERARGDIVAFIDDDAYPADGWLACAVKYFTDPSVGATGGPGVTPPGDGFLAKAGGRVYANPLVSGNYRYRYVAGRVRRDVDDYPSCNLLVRTDILRKIGGYRTDFWPGEDTLLCEAVVLGEKKRIVYDPWAIVYHHRRPLFAPHLRQMGRYAFHRGYFVKRFPATSRRLSYFIPTLFVLGLIVAPAIFALCPWPVARALVALPFAAYALLTVVTTFAVNPAMWLLTALGVFATHVWYGIRFAQGILAPRAPCEFIGKDHP